MRNSMRRFAIGGAAAIGTSVLVLTGCAAPPETDGNGNGNGETSNPDFIPCMVSDTGGFDDKSFNQLGYEGLTEAAQEIGATPNTVQSNAETDYASNISNLVDQGCNLIVTVGFLLAEATVAGAEANPDVEFTIIDDFADLNGDGKPDSDNIKPIVFDTAQAAFLAGYAAASYSKTGVVGTYGGIAIPPVTIFMDGFVQGVEYYNAQKGTSVRALGWDVAAQNGSFTGGFEAGIESKSLAQSLIDQNADVILPVGGPIFTSAVEAIRDSGKDIAMIGVDADLYETYPEGKDLFLTSILKGMKVGVHDVVIQASKGEFDSTPFVGTLDNDGVGIAPFHDFESKVDSKLADELDQVRKGIIDGSIEVTSPSSPKQ
ncbi:BMP family ABC transporter substrate-binding protein [Klugiella sp. YN-L-19]|uniref:BMP family ABC transporter substrate-binding protein n=2 Tax=Ruicaihuangia caeni TaxID=3042517 RepID=A0AAW6TCN7_9MICO|nr:BMP family ABC transporter substrate-binding protein [Klugiella sp. YN-L-19]MDI2099342.1 BMP family ABC transporter substrate-binding protein [Klugiella sp. YN-L-19]